MARGSNSRSAGAWAAAQPITLKPLSLAPDAPKVGVASSVGINGHTIGSTITIQSGSLPPGMTLDSAGRKITGTPTVAGSYSFTLRETLGGAVGTPKDTAQTLVVGVVVPAPVGVDFVASELADGAFNDAAAAVGLSPKKQILTAGTAGQDSGWLPIAPFAERLFYQLDSGTTSTQFSIDVSADGVTSLGQAFTSLGAASASGEFTPPLLFSNPLAKFFRFNVVSGGPLSVYRNA